MFAPFCATFRKYDLGPMLQGLLSLVQESCTKCKKCAQRWIRFHILRTCLFKHTLARTESKPSSVYPIFQLGNLEAQRVACWMDSPYWGPCLGPGAMYLGIDLPETSRERVWMGSSEHTKQRRLRTVLTNYSLNVAYLPVMGRGMGKPVIPPHGDSGPLPCLILAP